MSKLSTNRIDFAKLNELALACLEEILTDSLGLDVKIQGSEILMLNPRRQDYAYGSFSINSETGLWADFADDDAKGGDVVSLAAYILAIGQVEAAQLLTEFLQRLKLADSVERSASDSSPKVAARVDGARPSAPAAGNIAASPRHVSVVKPGETVPRLPIMPGLGTPTEYWYNDEAGLPITVVRRFDSKDGGKTFRPSTLSRNAARQLEWTPTAPDAPRPLYGLDRLAARPAAPVVLCEGEKAADAAFKLFPGAVTTTTMNGAQSPAKSDFAPLANREVLIWPDNDDIGQSYALKVARLIYSCGGTATVHVLKVPMFLAATGLDHEASLAETGERERGWDAADALAEGWSSGHAKLLLARPEALASISQDHASETPAEIVLAAVDVRSRTTVPEEFTFDEDGVYFLKRDREGIVMPTWLASKIEVVALSTSADGRTWGTVVRFPDADGGIREWCIPASMFGREMGDVWSVLLSMGAKISAQIDHRTQLANYLQQCKPTQRAMSVSQPGWSGDAFVFPDGTKCGQGPELIFFETRDPLQIRTFVPNGNLVDWQESVGAACVSNSRLVLAVCIALCAPTLRLLGEENGGFHFRGPSSIGKTTSLLVAASVWGRPERVMKRWRATSNGLEGVAANHNDLLLPLDEIGEITPTGASEAAYMLANGQGKARANTQGGARQPARWTLALISTGELSLADHLQSGGFRVKAGQEARLIDIEADAGAGHGIFESVHAFANGATLADHLKTACNANNGVLGRTFVEVLADVTSKAVRLARLEEFIADFESTVVPGSASGQVRRVAHRFGVVAAAGELASEAGLLLWPVGHAFWAARICFESWLSRRGGAGELEASQAIQTVRHHLQTRSNVHYEWLSHLGGTHDFQDRKNIPLYGYKRMDDDDRVEHLITPDAFKLEICAGLDEKAVRKHLFDAGFLVPAKDGQRTHSIRIPDIGPKRFLVINAKILGTDDDVVTASANGTQAPVAAAVVAVIATAPRAAARGNGLRH